MIPDEHVLHDKQFHPLIQTVSPLVQQSCTSHRKKRLKASEHSKCLLKEVSVFLRTSFKSLQQSCLTLRQLYLERVNPGEMDVQSVESQPET